MIFPCFGLFSRYFNFVGHKVFGHNFFLGAKILYNLKVSETEEAVEAQIPKSQIWYKDLIFKRYKIQ